MSESAQVRQVLILTVAMVVVVPQNFPQEHLEPSLVMAREVRPGEFVLEWAQARQVSVRSVLYLHLNLRSRLEYA